MNLCAEIQSATDTGNSRGMFEGIKKAIGPTQSKCTPLKTSTGETITDKSRLMEEGSVPQEMRDSIIIPMYKNKGDRSDRNNYRGISLLCITGKLFARVALYRLQKLAERVYPESQCGFRSKRSTVDMIFSVRQLQENCKEQHQPLYIAFIDLTRPLTLSVETASSRSCN